MDWNEIGKALIVGIPSFGLGYMVLRHAKHVDKVSAQAGAETQSQQGTIVAFDGLNKLIEKLEADNDNFRADFIAQAARHEALIGRFEAIIATSTKCKAEVARLRKKYES